MTTLWWGVRYGGIQYLPIFGQYFRNLNKNGRYLVFQSPNSDGKISDRKDYSHGIDIKI